jgi:hypothetical protein
MAPLSKVDAREVEFRSLETVKPKPLIQYLVARLMVGKAVRRQSAGEETTRSWLVLSQ